ncbi:MAG: hypothetical protein ACJAVI_000340 [Candidatus Azotimanducaceae bacterium]|jgi:hypothetical protein
MKDIIRIGNCSGFYGDKLGAAKDMVEGGPIDVLTGDYLAELTMTILYNQRSKKPNTGYVGTFLKQVRDVLTICVEEDIKIVTNAGGLNPSGMATEVAQIAQDLGLDVKVAYIDGDDLMPRLVALQDKGEQFENIDTQQVLADADKPPVTANVYLGAWGIKTALDMGADVVICPRVTDAAVVIGPAAWKFNWQRQDYDALAGALAAGHIIECGAQATGGNYSFFQEVPSFHNMGYPIAEIEANGHFTITKHPGTGGLVSVGTVKAQLLYEISTPAYLNPDVIAHFDTLSIEQKGDDRVYVSGCRGSSPPPTHKVCINTAGGFRNSMEMLLTGLDIEEKAEIFIDTLFQSVGGQAQFDDVTIQLIRNDKEDPKTNEEAYARLRIDVKSKDTALVGRVFSAKVIELALANFPAFSSSSAGSGGAYISYWPALVDSKHVIETVHMGGQSVKVQPTNQLGLEPIYYQKNPVEIQPYPKGETVRMPFGRIFGTRSGDKGGNANVGIWATTPEAFGFLHDLLTVEKFKTLLADTEKYEIERFDLPNLYALNFYIHGILGEGVSSSTRIDGQAKTMGEYLRAKLIDVPKEIAEQISL